MEKSKEKEKITNEQGQKARGKPIGNYITIDIKKLKIAQDEDIEKSAEIFACLRWKKACYMFL